MGQELRGSNDWPRYELWEERDEEGEVEKGVPRLHSLAIDIDGVRQCLERIEGDGEGKNDMRKVEADIHRHRNIIEEEIAILEVSQQPQVECASHASYAIHVGWRVHSFQFGRAEGRDDRAAPSCHSNKHDLPKSVPPIHPNNECIGANGTTDESVRAGGIHAGVLKL